MEGGSRHEGLSYPDEEWFYYQMASKFGWTPKEVDELSPRTADWLLAIGSTIERIKSETKQ